jgi:hypothetical protein
MTVEEVIKSKDELIAIKKTAIKYTDKVFNFPLKIENDEVVKVTISEGEDTEESTTQKVIANTYYWLDSHGDVHVKNCFKESIKLHKESKTPKIFHFDNHEHRFGAKVGNVIDVKEQFVKWRDLGIDKEGRTICLIGETELIEDYNCQVYDAYKKGEIDQHSVGMYYIDIQLAVNNPSEVEAYKLWNEIYPSLGNQDKADSQGYFWVVKQAKLKEYSCVLWNGSNELTPSIKNENENEDIEQSDDTQKEEQSDDTPITEEVKKVFNPNFY